jgi:hypothetical protein
MWPFKALLKTVFLEFHSLNSSKLVPFVNLYDLSLCGLSRPSTVSLELNQPILLLPNLPLDISIWLTSSNHLVLGYRLLTVNELILSWPLVICRWKKSLHPTREKISHRSTSLLHEKRDKIDESWLRKFQPLISGQPDASRFQSLMIDHY